MNAKIRAALALAATAALVSVAGASALAEGNGTKLGPAQRLVLENMAYDNATGDQTPTTQVTSGWSTGSDSPSDTKNSSALRVHVPAGDADTSYFWDAYNDKSISMQTPVADIRNLSFEFHNTESFGGGAPRISVQFNNGDVAYLDAYYCNNPLAVSPSWSRADFTGRKTAGCGFWVTGETGGFYESNGTTSAWGTYAAANPDQAVVSDYLVIDVAGDYALDRISLGTGKMFNRSNLYGVACTTESTC